MVDNDMILEKQKFIKKRRKARLYALQALYSWEISCHNLKIIDSEFCQKHNAQNFDYLYFKTLLYKIPKCTDKLQNIFLPWSARDLKTLNPIELTILRIATYELLYVKEVPAKVSINEAIELTKIFGASQSHIFINRVLDQVAKYLNCL